MTIKKDIMANQSTGARARRRGAVARGDAPDRRRGMWWLLAALLLLVIIAGVLIALLKGGSTHSERVSAKGAVPSASASSSTAAAVPPVAASSTAAPASTAAQGSTTKSAASAGVGLPAAGQVGGDGVPARTATGRLAPAGSIGAILFAEAGTGLDRPAHAVVTTAVKEIRTRHSDSVTVVGFTDSIGNVTANRTLSLERARRVVAVMRQQLGSSTTHFVAEARGETQPVAPNTTARGRQLDRRVEIFVK
jgi:outer membrane protein OmpA-like peptidoglycan-associated protein